MAPRTDKTKITALDPAPIESYLERLKKTGLLGGVKHPLKQTVKGMGEIAKGSARAVNQGMYDITGGVATGLDAVIGGVEDASGIGLDRNYFKQGVMDRYEGTGGGIPNGAPARIGLGVNLPKEERGPDYMNEANAGPQISPIAFDESGKVSANPRYGMPERPTSKLRSFEERMGEVLGKEGVSGLGSMEGLMASLFYTGMLGQDDSDRAEREDSLYKSDMTDIVNWNTEDRNERGNKSLIEGREAQTNAQQAIAENAPSSRNYQDAQTKQIQSNLENAFSKEEKINNLDMETIVSTIQKALSELENSAAYLSLSEEEKQAAKDNTEQAIIARVRSLRESYTKGNKNRSALQEAPK